MSDVDRILKGARRAYVIRSLETAPSSAPRRQARTGRRSWSTTEQDRELVAHLLRAKGRR
jgi:hypothetical protein